MTIGIVVTLKAKAGKAADLEAVFNAMAAEVRANEPNNQLYQLLKVREAEGVYVVMELYSDQAALDAHMASDHFKAARPKIAEVLAERPTTQFMDGV